MDKYFHKLFISAIHSGVTEVSADLDCSFIELKNNDSLWGLLEFKQGEDLEILKEEALRQIIDNRYYHGLKGEVLCIGIAHDKKRCGLIYKTVDIL